MGDEWVLTRSVLRLARVNGGQSAGVGQASVMDPNGSLSTSATFLRVAGGREESADEAEGCDP